MKINDILSVLLMLFSLYMAGGAVRAHDGGRMIVWLVVAILNALALYLSTKRRAREEAAANALLDEERSDEEEDARERLDDEDAQDEFDEEDL